MAYTKKRFGLARVPVLPNLAPSLFSGLDPGCADAKAGLS